MKKLLFVLLFLSPVVAWSQYVKFQMRVDELYSEAPQSNADSEFTWRFKTKIDNGSWSSVHCFHCRGTEFKWFSFAAGQLHATNNTNIIYNGYAWIGSTTYSRWVNGFEDDKGDRCGEDGRDNYKCSAEQGAVTVDWSLVNNSPGEWVRRYDQEDMCEATDSRLYSSRISYMLAPQMPTGHQIIDHNGYNNTNFCQGTDIKLHATGGEGFANTDRLEYVWQYNLNDARRETSRVCRQWETYTCDDPPIEQPLRAEQQTIASFALPPDGQCQRCIDWDIYYEDAYYDVGTTPVSANIVTKLAARAGDKLEFRVAIRNTATLIMGSWRHTGAVFVRQPAPALRVPAENGSPITSAADSITDAPDLDVKIRHVKCKGENTGRIIIKNVTGSGNYYYNLRRADGGPAIVLGIEDADGFPVVFPNDAGDTTFPTGLPAGKYTLRVENIENPYTDQTIDELKVRMCYESYDIYIREPQDPVSGTGLKVAQSTQNPFTISCYGGADGKVDVTGTGGVLPYTYTLGTAVQTTSGKYQFGSLMARKYTVNIADAFGCDVDIETEALTQPEILTINTPDTESYGPGGYTIACHGGTGPVNITTSGDDYFNRVISFGSDIQTKNEIEAATFNLPVGTHRIWAKYPHGCDTYVDVPMTQPDPIEASRSDFQSPSCLTDKGENDRDGYIELAIEGGIQSSAGYTSYLTDTADYILEGTTPKFEELKAGTYDLVVSDEYCTVTIEDFILPETTTPVRFNGLATIVEPSCHEYADGKITISGAKGIPYSDGYVFSINGAAKSAHFTTAVFNTNIRKGTYVLRVEDSKQCFADSTVEVNEPLPLATMFTLTQNICRGDSLGQIDAEMSGGTAPYSVRWMNAPQDTLLKEEAVMFSKIGKLPRGTYTFLMKDSRGCTNHQTKWYTLNQTLTDPDTLKVSPFSFEDISCYGADDGYVSLAASGGWGTFRYSRDRVNFTTANEFSGLPPGTNKFFVRDARGCVRSTEQYINEPAALEVSERAIIDAQCFGFSNGAVELRIAGGTGPYFVKPSTATVWEEGNQITGLRANTYLINVKDSHACPQDIEVVIGEPTALLLTQPLPSENSTCSEANGKAEVLASGGITPYDITWFNSAGDTVNTTASSTTLSSDVYRVTVVDKNKCLTPLEVEVSDEGAPVISDASITIPSCSYSSDGAIDVTITAATLPYTVVWSNNTITEDISGLADGSYRISIEDANRCRTFRTFPVDAPDQLDVIVDEQKHPTCFEYSDAFIDVSFTGGNGDYLHRWSNGSTDQRITDLKAGTYTVVLTDKKNCTYQESFTLVDPEKLVLGLEDRTICVGQVHTVELPVENGTYQWTSTNGFTSNQRTVAVSAVGIYSAHVVDENGCVADEQFELKTSRDLLDADFLVLQEAYPGDTVIVIDISWPLPDQIKWNTDSLKATVLYEGQDYAEFVFNEPGVYDITMVASLGECYATNVQSITILDVKDEEGDLESGRKKTSVISKFIVFPNPNDGEFTVEIELNEEVPGRLRMINLSGNQTLIDRKLEDDTFFSFDANLGNLVSGVYFIILEAGGDREVKRAVVR